jgi:hypothetical protein
MNGLQSTERRGKQKHRSLLRRNGMAEGSSASSAVGVATDRGLGQLEVGV